MNMVLLSQKEYEKYCVRVHYTRPHNIGNIYGL